jgi:predicted HD phosphohydrolase
MRTADILDRYHRLGGIAYEGEGVTQLQHAWQCGELARQAGAAPRLQLAAWLHDLGHLVSGLEGTPTLAGVDDRHEALSAAVLLPIFGAEVSEPVALHVDAKRYLVANRPRYADSLSPDSRRSLALQGGPMRPQDCIRFGQALYAADAVRLRIWDDRAKVATLHPVSPEAALLELARLIDAVLEPLPG